MPTYQYLCTSCAHEFELVQAFSDEAIKDCPLCQGAVRKIYNSVGVVFKGSGFYKTDSRAAKSEGTTSTSNSTASAPAATTPASSSPTSTPSTTSSPSKTTTMN
ncbi:MAG: FmdB family transcriptional regulator [Actinobacteria bacterium]|nr:FmdB family transcriptional regulator [Actinomycetota bacterium]